MSPQLTNFPRLECFFGTTEMRFFWKLAEWEQTYLPQGLRLSSNTRLTSNILWGECDSLLFNVMSHNIRQSTEAVFHHEIGLGFRDQI